MERAVRMDLAKVTGDIIAVQAQLFPAAQIALWARLEKLETGDIQAAMEGRQLVKAACMRRTLFLVPSDRVSEFVRGSARRAEKEIRWALNKGVPEQAIDAAIQAALGVLSQPRTRPEIAEMVSRKLGVKMQETQGGGWGSRSKVASVPVGHLVYPVVDLLHLAGARGVVCYGPYRDNDPTFVRADAWIPDWQDLPVEQAEEMLLRSYLKVYGPADAADYALWSGMTLTEARAICQCLGDDIVTADLEGTEGMVLAEDLEDITKDPGEPAPVRLLPYFDTYLLGHRKRTHLVTEEHNARVYRPQGWIAPVVLVNGQAAGVWEHARIRDGLEINVTPFEPLSHKVISGIRAESADLGRFLGTPEVKVVIGKIP
jgi:hypothetical protein